MEIDIIAVIISFFALGMSAYIGLKQVKINQKQADFQDKVELYLLNESITIRSADGSKPDEVFPGIFIRNVGNSVVYLERYIFDGKEYPLHKEVLPPVSAYNAFHISSYRPMGRPIFLFLLIFMIGRINCGGQMGMQILETAYGK